MGRVVIVALIVGVVLGLLGSGAGIAFFEATGQGRFTNRGATATAIPDRVPTASGIGGASRTPIAGATGAAPSAVDWQWQSPGIERSLGQARVMVSGTYAGNARGHLSLRDLQLVWGGRALRPDPNLSGVQFPQRNAIIQPGTEFDVDPRSEFTVFLVFLEVPPSDADLQLNGLPGVPSLSVR
jgi:hypothetical protein